MWIWRLFLLKLKQVRDSERWWGWFCVGRGYDDDDDDDVHTYTVFFDKCWIDIEKLQSCLGRSCRYVCMRSITCPFLVMHAWSSPLLLLVLYISSSSHTGAEAIVYSAYYRAASEYHKVMKPQSSKHVVYILSFWWSFLRTVCIYYTSTGGGSSRSFL